MTQTAAPAGRAVSQEILNKIANAQATVVRRPNIRDGIYLFEVRAVLSEDKRNNVHCFIVELGVIESKASEDPSRPGIIPNAPGTVCGSVVKLNKDSAPGNVKRFILGIMGVVEDEMYAYDAQGNAVRALTADEKAAEIKSTYADMVGINQPMKGWLLRATTYHTKIQTGPNAGQPFVGCNWEFVPRQTDEMISARRLLIEKGAIGTALSDAERATITVH